jgi:predicted RNase H-like HicB family nuclease
MARYVAVIEGTTPSYTATFPDVPGCATEARTTDEVIDRAIEALADYARTRNASELPAPREVGELRRRRDVRLAIGRGAMLVLVPLIAETGRTTHANLSIDDGLLAAIDEAATRFSVTRSAFIAAAAREKLLRSS